MLRIEFSSRPLLQRCVAAGVILYSSAGAWAMQGPPGSNHHHGGGGGGNCGGGQVNAPEINPALMVSALVLLVGIVLIVSSRRRRAAGPAGH